MTDRPLTLDAVLAGRTAIWGMGAEGLALTALALGRGTSVVLVDDRPAEAAARVADAVGFPHPVVGPDAVEWSGVDVVVRSPGVSRYRSELGEAAAGGVAVTTTMALWLEDNRDAPVLAVTGTKGKSTTATLAAAILEADGRRVELLGNIGVPVLDTYGRPRPDAYVVEVSSYQAADVTRSPGVVVLTSLAPDHLVWHGGLEQYYRDKLRLIDAGPPGALAVGAGNAEALRRTADHPRRTLFGPEGRVCVTDDGWVDVDGTRLVDTARLRVSGVHNAWNLCGAVAGVLLLTGTAPSAEAMDRTVDTFDGLPSRCAVVGVRDGRTYVDDALASNPFASAASIATFADRPLAVIVGGADRGVDPGPLRDAVAHHQPTPVVVVLPPDPERTVRALEGTGADVLQAPDLAAAVRMATERTPTGGVVLFSPGAPTPDGEGGFGSRSRQFAAAAGWTDDAP